MGLVNHQVGLASLVEGRPRPENFALRKVPCPAPGPGEVLLRHLYLSLDPYQRPAMSGRHLTAAQALPIGGVPAAETIGEVVESRHPDWRPGDTARSMGGWQEYSVASATGLHRVDGSIAPLSAFLGVLGMPGLTAWASVTQLARVQAGQTVLVSAAAGPVGSLVGQLSRLAGAQAWGIAGSAAKCDFIRDELGFAGCVDRHDPGFVATLRAAVPAGIDVYHDNVGGQLLHDVLGALRPYGTVVLCGLMDRYNDPAAGGSLDLGLVIRQRAVLRSLVVFDFEARRGEFVAAVAPLVRSGAVRYREDRVTGLGNAPAHFARLMAGETFGKALVVLAPGHAG